MQILITGGSGQLGRDLQRVFATRRVVALGHAELDVSDVAAVDAAFDVHQPQVVVHCAALTDTARCERDPKAAHAVNVVGAGNVGIAAGRLGATFVAVSTNEVFDGMKSAPYVESDATKAVNAYGASKLEGELRAMTVNPDARIVRTSWLYGDGVVNFVEKVLAASRAGRRLSFVTDEIATPTSTLDLARAIQELIARDAAPGVYHLANEGNASRYEWARAILQLAGLGDTPLEAVTTDDLRAGGYGGPAKPPCSVLANVRAKALGVVLRPWGDALAAYFERAKASVDA